MAAERKLNLVFSLMKTKNRPNGARTVKFQTEISNKHSYAGCVEDF